MKNKIRRFIEDLPYNKYISYITIIPYILRFFNIIYVEIMKKEFKGGQQIMGKFLYPYTKC